MKKPVFSLKMLSLALATVIFAVMLYGCGGRESAGSFVPTLIAPELDSSAFKVRDNGRRIPDFPLFYAGMLDAEETEEDSSEGHASVTFRSEADSALFLEYLELLTDKYGFEIVGTYNFDPDAEYPFTDSFFDDDWEIALASTKVDFGRELTSYELDCPCDLYFHTYIGETVYLNYTAGLKSVDFGERCSEVRKNGWDKVVGDHAVDGYVLAGNTLSSASDPDFKVTSERTDYTEYSFNSQKNAAYMGNALVRINGRETVADAMIVPSKTSADYTTVYRQCVEITDFISGVSDEKLSLYLPCEIEEGTALRYADFLTGHQNEKETVQYGLYFYPSNGDEALSPEYGQPTYRRLTAVTVRVLKWDKEGHTRSAVYIALEAEIDGERLELEAIVLAPYNDKDNLKTISEAEAESDRGNSYSGVPDAGDPYIPDFAKQDCLTCGGDGDCNNCGGDGKVEYYSPGGNVTSGCPYCYGSGNCRTCNGSGKR